MPPPSDMHETIGNPKSYPERSAHEYPKQQKTTGGMNILTDGLPADQKAALAASVERNAFRPPEAVEPPKPSEPPADTSGIAEMANPTVPDDFQPIREPVSQPDIREPVSGQSLTPEGEATAPWKAGSDLRGDREEAYANERWKKAQDKFGAAPISKKPGGSSETSYDHPHMPDTAVVRDKAVPELVSSSDDGKQVFIDKDVPRSLDVNEKKINPADALAVREIYSRHAEHQLEQRGQLDEKSAEVVDRVGRDAERGYLEEYHGFNEADWNRYQQLMKPLEPKPDASAQIDAAAAKTNTAPTEAQKESGKYKKGVADVQGIKVAIETPRGETRSGKDANGKLWSVEMPAHYGEIEGTRGADGDKVDAYIGPKPDAERAQIIVQRDLTTGQPDEHKVMIGFPTKEAALDTYKQGFSDGRGAERIMSAHDVPMEYLKRWLKSDQTKVAKAPMKDVTATVTEDKPAFSLSEPRWKVT